MPSDELQPITERPSLCYWLIPAVQECQRRPEQGMPGADFNDPFVSQAIWNEVDHDARIACLCLFADQAWVREAVAQSQIAAVQEVNRRWNALPRNVTEMDLPVFHQERAAAREAAVATFWDDLEPQVGRCAHGASEGGCRVRGCDARWHPPTVPSDRFFKGALRRQILERDNYTCQYCGKRVSNDLPDDHPDRANVDHVIHYPVGPTSLENGKTACTVCNAIKGDADSFPKPIPIEDV